MNEHVRRLLSMHFGTVAGELVIGGCGVTAVAAHVGTPCYIYAPDVFRAKVQELRAALPAFKVYYALKANPTPAVVQTFADAGCGLAAATAAELNVALQCVPDPQAVVLAGAGQTRDELTRAVDAGIGEIHVESPESLALLAKLQDSAGRRLPVVLRFNPGAIPGTALGGKPAAYGFDEETLCELANRVSGVPGLHVRGIHGYFGTQVFEAAALLAAYRHTVVVAQRVGTSLGRPLTTVDFGGGFGVPYYENETPFDLHTFAAGVSELVSDVRNTPSLQEVQLVVEPGRFLAAEGGLYVTRILARKTSRGKEFVIVDGGLHHHLAASGNLGHVIRRNFPIVVVNRVDAAPVQRVDIVGRQCTALDTLARDVALPEASPGDLIVILASGAYARSASPLAFRSHPPPPEVFVQDGNTRVVG